jgi:spore maturation protein CgeB
MLKVNVLYRKKSRVLTQRILTPLENGVNDGHFILSAHLFGTSKRVKAEIFRTDVLVIQDEHGSDLEQLVKAARSKGIRVVYDYSESVMRTDSNDIRAQNARFRLMQECDLITHSSDSLTSDWAGLHVPTLGSDVPTSEFWSHCFAGDFEYEAKSNSEQKHIFVINPTYMWPHQSISDMCTRLLMQDGHRVTLFTGDSTRYHKESIGNALSFNAVEQKSVEDFKEPLWKLPLMIERVQPDLVFAIQGYMIPRPILERLRTSGVKSAVWLLDEPYDSTVSQGIGSYFSHVFVQDKATVTQHRHIGNSNTWYIPHGGDPENVQRVGKSFPSEYERDIGIVGTPFRDRVEVVASLLNAGMDLTAVGTGWRDAIDSFFQQHPEMSERGTLDVRDKVSLEEASEFYNRTKVNLNIHRDGSDHSTTDDSIAPVSPNCSLFYIAAARGFQLVDANRVEGITECFRPNEEIVFVESKDDWVHQVNRYLESTERRMSIAEATYQRVLSEHRYTDRLRDIIQLTLEYPIIECNRLTPKFTMIDVMGSKDAGIKVPVDAALITITADSEVQDSSVSSRTTVKLDPSEGFAAALNVGTYLATGDYLIVGCASLMNSSQFLCDESRAFTNDLDLGLIEFFSAESDETTGFMMPLEFVLELGKFNYSSSVHCFQNLVACVKRSGYVIERKELGEFTLEGSVYSQPIDSESHKVFLREVSDNPESKAKSDRLLDVLPLINANAKQREALLQKAVDLSPGNGRAHLQLGLNSLRGFKGRSDLMKAIRALRSAWEIDPDSASSGLAYAIALRMGNQSKEAQQVLEHLLLQPLAAGVKADCYLQYGRSFERTEPMKALENYRKSLDLDPSNSVAAGLLSAGLRKSDSLDEAKIVLTTALGYSNEPFLLYELGETLRSEGRFKEAFEALKDAADQDPKMRNIITSMILCAKEIGFPRKVLEYVSRYLETAPRDTEMIGMHRKLSSLCNAQGN